jgi:hypothetical protein
MSIHGACFDIGIGGGCPRNCYKCKAYSDDNLDDKKIAEKVGEKEQKRMLEEFESEESTNE